MNVPEIKIKSLLVQHKKIVVIGISADSSKPSQRVPLYLKSRGYDIVGVNPGHTDIAGIKMYNSLRDVPKDYLKFVNVFRRAEHIPGIIDEILQLGGTEVLWLQLGITHPEAEKKAESAGILVVSNRCLLIEHKKYNVAAS